MVRRSLWIGLQLGLLAGVAFAVVKTVQARRAAREPLAPPSAWRPPPEPGAGPQVQQPAEAPRREAPRRETPTRPGPSRPEQPPMPPRPSATPATPASAEPPEAPATASEPAAPAKKAAKKAKKAKKAAKKATRKAANGTPSAARAWIESDEGACPQSHPVKAKLSSKIFHLPGMFAYERTNADRCYRDADAASGDGFRPAKR